MLRIDRLRLTGIAVIVAVALVVAACGGGDPTPTPRPTSTPSPVSTPTPTPVAATPTPSAPQPQYGGEFTMRVSGSFANEWNNYTPSGQFAVLITQNLLNNLTSLDAVDASTIRPDLAEAWTVSPDGRTLTYTLRQGVRWHDGASFSSQDVVTSLNRARSADDPKASVHSSKLQIIESVDAPDDRTVSLRLSRASASILRVLSIPSLTIYPAHIPDIDQWKTNPIGTGPFTFGSFEASTSADYARNPDYFKVDEAGSPLPYLDTVSWVWIPDQALAFSAFRTGRLSCACGYNSDIFVNQIELAQDSIPGVRTGGSWGVNFLQFNTARPPFDDIRIRRAVHIGMDRLQLTQTVRGGTGFYPPTFFLPRGLAGGWALPESEMLSLPGFRDPKTLDTDASQRLFDEAGVTPQDLRPLLVGSSTQAQIGEAIVSIFGLMGITLDVSFGGRGDRVAQLRRGDFDLTWVPSSASIDDPSELVLSKVKTDASLNYGKIANPEIDRLLETQDAELDPLRRQQLIGDLQRVLLEEAAFVPIHGMPDVYAVQPFVRGFVLDRAFAVTSAHRLDRVWFDG